MISPQTHVTLIGIDVDSIRVSGQILVSTSFIMDGRTPAAMQPSTPLRDSWLAGPTTLD